MIWVVLGNYYNNWRIIMGDEELMKYSRELEEDLDGAIYHPDPDHKSETGKNGPVV